MKMDIEVASDRTLMYDNGSNDDITVDAINQGEVLSLTLHH